PVAGVRRPVRPPFECADVTERAAMDAAHVRVQRPLEPHALHPVERRAARLFAILDGHSHDEAYRTYVRRPGGARAGDSQANAAAADRAAPRPLLPPRE